MCSRWLVQVLVSMLGERRSSLLVLLLLSAIPAAGQNFSASATVLETTSAEITNLTIVTASPVDFLFTIHNTGNTNISAFPEITVYDSNNNTIVQLIYNTDVNMSAGSVKDLELNWITNLQGSFTAKLVVFYDNNSRSATAFRTFVLTSSYPPAGGGESIGGGSLETTPEPSNLPASVATPAPKMLIPSIPQETTPVVTVTAVTIPSSVSLSGILAGILGFALPKGGTVNLFWILVAIIGILVLYIYKRKRHI